MVDEKAEAAKKKQQELEQEIARVTQEYEEKQRRKKEKAKEKAAKSKEDDKAKKESNEEDERKDLEREKDEKVRTFRLPQRTCPDGAYLRTDQISQSRTERLECRRGAENIHLTQVCLDHLVWASCSGIACYMTDQQRREKELLSNALG